MAKPKKLPSGNWRVRVYMGKDENGKDIYQSVTDPDKDQVVFLASQLKVKGSDKKDDTTLKQAIEGYIDSKRNILSPTTIHGYETIYKHRLDKIGNLFLTDLNDKIMQRYINTLAATLSAKSVYNTYGLISAAVKLYAPQVRLNVTLPPKKRQVKKLPTPEQVMRAVKGTSVELPALLSMWLSLRMSEVRGLRYGDVEGNVLTIQRTTLLVEREEITREQTKTYNSTRQLRLPPYLVKLIGQGKPNEPIIKDSYGAIYGRFVTAIENAGLPHMRFHDLRHLNASIMVQLGVPDKYAMERGGWSTDSTLRNVYQHTFSNQRTIVDDKIDNYFESILEET